MTRLLCSACGRRFGRRARVYLINGSSGVLCRDCVNSTAVHAEWFFTCTEVHTCRSHCTVTSRGFARMLTATR
jgi:hypothetical protein